MQPGFEENVRAFARTVRAVIGLGEGFTDAEWAGVKVVDLQCTNIVDGVQNI